MSQEQDPTDGTSKVKVTILASEWGSSKGGLSTINRELAIQLGKCPEVEITFFLPQCSEEDKKVALKHNIKIVEATRLPGYEEVEWVSFPPEDLQIDIVVGHGVKLGHQAQVIRNFKKCKWVQVVHTDPEELAMFKDYSDPISKGEEKHKTEVELCEMADQVVGVGPKLSEAFRSYLRGCQKHENVLDFTPGVFEEFVSVKQVPDERKNCSVLVFGRGDAEDFALKGFDIAGKAVAALPDTRLLFVGAPDGKQEEIKKRLTGCGVPASRLRVRGYVQNRESLKRLFQEVDLVLMPSRTEGFGLTGLEALSAGLPVLVSQNSGFGETLSNVPFGSSYVIGSEDPKDWAAAIKKIWDKDRKRRLEEAEILRDSYQKKYNWTMQIKDLLDKIIGMAHADSSDGQSSKQTKSGMLPSAGEASQRIEDMPEHHTGPKSIFPDLQKMQSDADKVYNKTDLSVDLRKIALDKGFTISNNPASGNCMFYALSEQLQSVRGIQISHKELRRTLVQFLMENANLRDGTPLFNFVCGYPSWPKYLGSMAKDGTWGDNLVLLAAANYFQTHIRIISSLGRELVISSDGPVAHANPLVLGHVHELHYVSLQPKQDPEPRFTTINERTNVSRLCHLVVSLGSKVLRDTFDRKIPPRNLQSILKGNPAHLKLQSLRKKGILSSVQWSKLYPGRSSPVSSTAFNFPLLIALLRTICNLSAPPAGWDAPPHTADISCESDIARLKYFMNAVSGHAEKGSVCNAVFNNYWQQIRDTLVRLGGAGYEDAIDEMKNQEMDPLDEEHFKALLKQWNKDEESIKDKLNELESAGCEEQGVPHPTHVIERIHQLYRTSEERLLPLPWCEDFSFHLNDIFTRLKIVSKEKTRGELTDEITNMTAIFKSHSDCKKPRTVLIEGDPGMGKTTYCQKLAYDWATKQEEWDASFPEIEVLLLLRCYDIKSDIWEAIDEQILPVDLDYKDKNNFFKFIRENQSKVLLVLDGVDEADPSKLGMYFNLVQSKELSGCPIVLTSRHEAGRKVRRYCDTLWEIVGFTKRNAKKFIRNYFKNKAHMADKLLEKIWDIKDGRKDLSELTKNPLNTALLCVLHEDFKGVFPANRTQLYIELVLCVLRRYEKKNGLSSKNDDLIKEYKESLLHIGRMALQSLRKGELYIEEHESDSKSNLSKFGFLSIQAGGSKRKPCLRYGFLHKTFQEFFAGFCLAFEILNGEIDCDSVVTDQRYRNEMNQVFLFMSGILASRCVETTVSLVNSIVTNINLLSCNSDFHVSEHFKFAFDCILECTANTEDLQSRLVRNLGVNFDLKSLTVSVVLSHVVLFFEALAANSSLTNLDLSGNDIGSSGAVSVSRALAANSSLTNLDLRNNMIGSSGAVSVSQVLADNSSLTNLDLRGNEIGSSGAVSLSRALAANSSLTNLDLSGNDIGSSGAVSLSRALADNSSLTNLDLRNNMIGPSGAASLSQALAANSSLTNLNLRFNMIGSSGADFLSQALAANSSLTNLDLSFNKIGSSGAASLSQALAANSSLTNFDLSHNEIGPSGAASLSQALAANSSLTNLDLSVNKIGCSGAASLSQALEANSSLTDLDLSINMIGPSGAVSLSQALAANSSLTNLDLSVNKIGCSGAASLSQALAANSSLTNFDLSYNEIGPSGAASLSQALAANSSLTNLNLTYNKIGSSGAASLSQALAANSSLTHLNLSYNMIGSSGAAALSVAYRALATNSSLTNLDLSDNGIGSSGAAYLSQALAANSSLTNLDLRGNEIGPSGAAALSEACKVNTTVNVDYEPYSLDDIDYDEDEEDEVEEETEDEDY